jgi:alpha-tubulin suppressor-like RCC1 family protein/Leucine-rich repeat (LRR) protein
MKKTLLLLLTILSCLQINSQCWKTVTSGYSYTVATQTDNSLWSWGENKSGQLGDGTLLNNYTPKKIGTATDWKIVVTGTNHTVALKNDGSLWTWGSNKEGQLGDGTYTGKSIPIQIGTATNWQTVAAGNQYTVALKNDGTLWAWGDNYFGELGNGTSSGSSIPKQIGTATDWKSITVGYYHTIALKTDGTLWTWGGNNAGQLGDGTISKSYSPKKIGTATDWKIICGGGSHTLAIKTDGSLWAWGQNKYGELGNGTTTDSYVPTKIGTSTDWKSLGAGGDHTIAIKTDNSLWTWGYNSDNELGNGTTLNSLVPIQIGSSKIWQDVSAGWYYTAAVSSDGVMWTFGDNADGQLGDGTNVNKNVPITVVCPSSFTMTTSQANITCFGDKNGSASVTSVSGGTTPYSYLWSNGATTEKITGLSAGTYSCTVTDASSLSITNSFDITEPIPLIATTTSTNTDCNGNNGIITITANGGTAPYQYAISNLAFQSSNVFTGLSAGTYVVNVKDSNGCISSNTIVITTNTTPPPTVDSQTFNTNAKVSSLQAVGSNIQWYNAITGGIVLDVSVALQTGKYYASQTINGCESSRTAVDVTVTPVSANEPIPTSGLLAYYSFTGNANDTSGNGNNGIATDVTLTSNRFGMSNSAYSFNGTSSNIESDIANYPLKGGSRTITGWFKADAPTVSHDSDFCVLNYGNINDPNYWFKISLYSKGYLDMQFDSKTFSSQENYFNNEWTFFAMTFDEKNNTYSLYINGVYKIGGVASLYTNGFDNFFRIGRNKLNNYFEGAIDDIGVWNRLLTQEEITGLYSVNNDLFTLIPDSNFEQKLIDLGIDSGNTDGKIPTSKINTVTHLNVSNGSITDLTGIQDFTQLTDLYCNQNQLIALNISKNTFLKTLVCNNNKLETLDVSNNIALDSLSCYTNRLTALDVKINKTLKKLDCGSNQISSLDVSTNTALTFLGCNTSLLTTLNVSNNTALNLLDCRENKLTSLDVSQITALTELYCQSNQLTNLDISKNKALEFLNCSKNKLTTLDVSVNTALVGLYSNSNQLKNLNLKNGNNVKIGYLNLINNPNLSCIQVDDIDYFNTNWSSKKDAMANFNTDCPDSNPYTLIPDPNFEQKLIDLGIDTDGLNGKITITDISAITTLDLSNSNIKDLTGIENFTALNILDCRNNQLITLDLSKNTNLQILYVAGNPLVYINLKNGNNQNLITASQTSKKTGTIQGTSFLGLTALGCVKVDNAVYSNANWAKIKETATAYSETCTLGLEDSEFNKAAVYPNPTKGEINILNIALEKATVYNALGQLVKTFVLDSASTNNTINLSGLPKGVYFVYLINQDAVSVKKVIVE